MALTAYSRLDDRNAGPACRFPNPLDEAGRCTGAYSYYGFDCRAVAIDCWYALTRPNRTCQHLGRAPMHRASAVTDRSPANYRRPRRMHCQPTRIAGRYLGPDDGESSSRVRASARSQWSTCSIEFHGSCMRSEGHENLPPHTDGHEILRGRRGDLENTSSSAWTAATKA